MENSYIKIELIGKRSNEGILEGNVEISEKLDGANLSFYREKEGDPLTFRSRRIELNENTGMHGFRPGIDMIREADSNNPFPPGKMFFGEHMTPHVIFYGNIPNFIGFSVMDIASGIYEANWQKYFEDREIPIVIFINMSNPAVDDLKALVNRKSEFGDTECIQEGIVIKNYDTQLFAKIVREVFKEDAGRGKGYCIRKTDEDKFVKRFCTPARVRKVIFKTLEEHPEEELDMPIMKYIAGETAMDILQEEILTIAKECQGDFNFRLFKKGVSNECRATLQNMIIEQASVN